MDFSKLSTDPRVLQGLAEMAKTYAEKNDPVKAKLDKKEARTFHGPYYNKEHALEVKDYLNVLHTNRRSLKIVSSGLSINTLRLKFYQGKKYLLDNLDPEGKYKNLINRTKCITMADYLELHIKQDTKVLYAETIEWKPAFLDFIENAQLGTKFPCPDNIMLSNEEVQWIKDQLDPLSDLFIYDVKPNKFLVIRINPNNPL